MMINVAYGNPAPIPEKWTEEMRRATPEVACKLRQHALESLDGAIKSQHQYQEWNALVGIAEQVLDERKIRYRPNPGEELSEILK